MIRHGLMLTLLIFVLGFVNYQIYGKEQLISEGQTILLELAPVDPRSLIQGDYMTLRYAIADEIEYGVTLHPNIDSPSVVVLLDANNVASYKHIYQPNEPLAAGEQLLTYHRRNRQILIGAESFFFQEGEAGVYVSAEYGELVIDENGNSVLVGLRDAQFQALGRDRE